MAKRVYYNIHGEKITKSKALEKARDIKNNGKPGSVLSQDEFEWMTSYWSIIHERDIWDIIEIHRIPEVNNIQGQITLQCELMNGDFRIASVQLPKPYKLKVKEAFRSSIDHITLDFKSLRLGLIDYKCELCSKDIDFHSCHVDHYELDFKDLLSLFISDDDIEKVAVFKQKHPRKYALSDERLRDEFIDFHNKNTHLRLLCPSCNYGRNKS